MQAADQLLDTLDKLKILGESDERFGAIRPLIVVWLFVRLRRLQRYPAALRDLQEALRAADAGDEDRLARLLGPPEITTLVGQYTRLGLARREARRDIDIARIVFESGDGMLVTDSHGVVVRVNRAFSRITGYSATEAIGRRTTFLRSGRHDAAFYARMWARVELYGRWEGEIGLVGAKLRFHDI